MHDITLVELDDITLNLEWHQMKNYFSLSIFLMLICIVNTLFHSMTVVVYKYVYIDTTDKDTRCISKSLPVFLLDVAGLKYAMLRFDTYVILFV